MGSPQPERRIGSRIAHYRIDAVLGSGGMGTVYRAYDRKLERPVALKFIHPGRTKKGLDQFLKEVRTVSSLNDPNIITIHGFDQSDDGPFIVMEFIEGTTLRALADARDGDALGMEEIVRIGLQVSSALRVAHAAGVVHRDIKPENVMVRQQDRLVKLLDFGLARLMRPAPPLPAAGSDGAISSSSSSRSRTPAAKRQPWTSSSNNWGTLRYMSPEQVFGRRLTSATDIFSLGVVLYELLTKVHPFSARDHVSTIAQILERPPKPPRSINPAIPDELAALVIAMLAKAASDRPDARTVMDRLARMRGHIALRPGNPHIVGRHKELKRAADRLELPPRSVLLCVSGEAGAGKTTFVEEFLVRIDPSYLRLRGRCEKLLAEAEAYLPLLEVLHALLRTDRDGTVAALLKNRAPHWYQQVGAGPADTIRSDQAESPERMNREFFEFLNAVRADRPVVLFLDDIQWADVSTVYLLDYMTARAATLPLFIVVTLRPEALDEAHPFQQVVRKLAAKDLCDELALDLLTPDDVRHYIDLEFRGHRFPQRFIRLIHKQTEGNPLFMVDLLRDLRARDILTQREGSWRLRPISNLELPKRVESLIDQKIAALADADRALLSWAAVQGYEFDSSVLAKAMSARADDVETRLDVLERKHALVRRIGNEELPSSEVTVKYRFTHVLYQNALEERLLRTPSRRAEINRAVADALIGLYGVQRRVVASQLARLFEAARELSLAVDYFQTAAENAAQVSAHHEAAALLGRGVELLHKLPADRKRDERELAMQLALGASLMALKGFGAAAVRDAYKRAQTLCDALGDPDPQRQMVLRGLWGYHLVRADYKVALDLAYSLYGLAMSANNTALLVEGHHALAFTLCHMGELPKAVRHRQLAIKLHSDHPEVDYGFPFALDPGVGCRVEYAMDLWMLGYPDQAAAEAKCSRELAEALGHPYSYGFSLMFSAVIHELRGEIEQTLEYAEMGIRLAREHNLKEVLGWSLLRRGWAIAMLGDPEDGINLQRTILKRQREMGSEIARPHFLGALASSMLKAKRPEAALPVIEEALETGQQTGARYYHAELLRLRGECAIALGESTAKAEDLFWRAREVARGQEARSFELRVAISLARLFDSLQRTEDGRAGLAEIYSWFQEGFDTEDLREARELLTALQ